MTDAETQPDTTRPVWQDTVDCQPYGRWQLPGGTLLEFREAPGALDVWLPGRRSWLSNCDGLGYQPDEDRIRHAFDATRCILSFSSHSYQCEAEGMRMSAYSQTAHYDVQFDADHLHGAVQIDDHDMPDDIQEDHTSSQRWLSVSGERVDDDQMSSCGCGLGPLPTRPVDLAAWHGEGGVYRGRVQVTEFGAAPESWGDERLLWRWARVEFMQPTDEWAGPPMVWLGVPDDGSTWVTLVDAPPFELSVGDEFSLSIGAYRGLRDEIVYTIPNPQAPERPLMLAVQGGVDRLTDRAIDWRAHFSLRVGPVSEIDCEGGWEVLPLEVSTERTRDHLCAGPDWVRLGDSGAVFHMRSALRSQAPDSWVDLVVQE
jgi:hypothetical protein